MPLQTIVDSTVSWSWPVRMDEFTAMSIVSDALRGQNFFSCLPSKVIVSLFIRIEGTEVEIDAKPIVNDQFQTWSIACPIRVLSSPISPATGAGVGIVFTFTIPEVCPCSGASGILSGEHTPQRHRWGVGIEGIVAKAGHRPLIGL